MTLSTKIQIGVVTAVALVLCWQVEQHRRQGRELAAIQAQVQSETEKAEARRAALAELEHRDSELVEVEKRAGNQTLISLMRERAAAAADARSGSPAGPETHGVGGALARVLDSPDQQQIDREAKRDEMRANLGLFFKLVKLPPEKINQYIDLQIEKESHNANRMSALLQGKVAPPDALRERDNDNLAYENQQRALLGPEGSAFLDSIAEGMRNDEAKRLVNGVQAAMAGDTLSQEQKDRLQTLLKTQLVTIPFDNTDLFRPPEEWAQIVGEREQNVLSGAADFLNPTQLETLRTLAAADLADRQMQMMSRRKSLGIK